MTVSLVRWSDYLAVATVIAIGDLTVDPQARRIL